MTSLQYLSEDELIQNGLEALMKALGPIETTRFLTLPHPPPHGIGSAAPPVASHLGPGGLLQSGVRSARRSRR